jgi:hypothetical protein
MRNKEGSVQVPVIASDGASIVFGATIILQPTFPTYVPISKHLDLSNSIESKIASAHFNKVLEHCHKMNGEVEKIRKRVGKKNPMPDTPTMRLQTNDELWVKTINHQVYQGGLGLFHSDDSNPRFIDTGLRHMLTVLALVYRSEHSRGFAEYPLSIRTPCDSHPFYQMIFRIYWCPKSF